MARKPHKYHYIYKTTCNVTGKYYFGMHSTSNLEDGYMGSGKMIRRSLNKHGIEKHTKEILEFLDDRESLKKREKEIVNENMIQDPLCMNLQLGGGGGFNNEENQRNRSRAGGIAFSKKLKNDLEFREEHIKRASNKLKLYHSLGNHNYNTFSGKNHSEETKQKMREKASQRIGEKNSQYGTCWITNGVENKKIKKTDLIPDGWELGRKK